VNTAKTTKHLTALVVNFNVSAAATGFPCKILPHHTQPTSNIIVAPVLSM